MKQQSPQQAPRSYLLKGCRAAPDHGIVLARLRKLVNQLKSQLKTGS